MRRVLILLLLALGIGSVAWDRLSVLQTPAPRTDILPKMVGEKAKWVINRSVRRRGWSLSGYSWLKLMPFSTKGWFNWNYRRTHLGLISGDLNAAWAQDHLGSVRLRHGLRWQSETQVIDGKVHITKITKVREVFGRRSAIDSWPSMLEDWNRRREGLAFGFVFIRSF